jgi:hypothetical protein
MIHAKLTLLLKLGALCALRQVISTGTRLSWVGRRQTGSYSSLYPAAISLNWREIPVTLIARKMPMLRRLKLSPLQRNILMMLEEAGAETARHRRPQH